MPAAPLVRVVCKGAFAVVGKAGQGAAAGDPNHLELWFPIGAGT